jgi:hypothetical protein
MIRSRFTDMDAKRRELGPHAGRFPFKRCATGELLIAAALLGFPAIEDISLQVVGPAT